MSRPVKAVALSVCITAATMGLSCQYVSAGEAPPPLVNGSNSASASSWVGGAQVGYNWQRNSFVYGLEADISAMHLKSEMNSVLQPSPATANTNASVDWYGTFRGRLGWSAGPILLYGTGGLAYGNVDLNSSISYSPFSLYSQTSSVKVGWVAGGGIEYMWRPNVTLNLAYQYVDLGTVSLADPISTLSQNASAHAAFSVVTVGFNWRFSPSGMTPMPWQGMYVGGHAGGAWGLSTDADYSSPLTVGVDVSDVRLKRDIVLVGRLDDGLGLYRYRYLWSDTVYVGVMAQEVALIHPDAIVRDSLDDYLRVDYGRLGLRLMTLPDWDARSKGERL